MTAIDRPQVDPAGAALAVVTKQGRAVRPTLLIFTELSRRQRQVV